MDKENEPTKILEFLARIKTVRQAASSMTFQAFPLRQMIKATLFSECTVHLVSVVMNAARNVIVNLDERGWDALHKFREQLVQGDIN